MNNPILSSGTALLVSAMLPDEAAFVRTPIWYEVYDPSDVEIIRRMARNDDWVDRHVVQPIKIGGNKRRYYAREGGKLISGRMYTYVAGEITTLEVGFRGFGVFVDSDLFSVELFNEAMTQLSRSAMLAIENYDGLHQLGVAIDGPSSMEACFRARHDAVGVAPVKFRIPIEQPPEVPPEAPEVEPE